MAKDIIWQTPDKEVTKENHREFDDKGAVILFLAHDIKPVCVEAKGYRMIWVFDNEEVGKLFEDYFSGKSIMVDYQGVITGETFWLKMLSILRNRVKN